MAKINITPSNLSLNYFSHFLKKTLNILIVIFSNDKSSFIAGYVLLFIQPMLLKISGLTKRNCLHETSPILGGAKDWDVDVDRKI